MVRSEVVMIRLDEFWVRSADHKPVTALALTGQAAVDRV